MQDEPVTTDIDLDDYRVVVLALTGPPSAGKSTAVSLLRDMDIPCKDTGDAIRERAQNRYDDPDEDQIWTEAELLRDEHGPAAPVIVAEDWITQQRVQGHEVVCISSLREQASVEWLRANIGPVLCVRIEASRSDRMARYLDQQLDAELDRDRETVPVDLKNEIRNEIIEREERETPYPQHDVQIENPNSTGMMHLWKKLENVVSVLEA